MAQVNVTFTFHSGIRGSRPQLQPDDWPARVLVLNRAQVRCTEIHLTGAAKPGIHFAVWAPYAQNVEVVFAPFQPAPGTPTGYIAGFLSTLSELLHGLNQRTVE
jgi:hypothetical protein